MGTSSNVTSARLALAGPPSAGTRLAGRYRLADRIGGADGSSLWKGTDEMLARPVTVQLIPGPAPAPLAAAIRAAGRLADARLARIYDADDRAAPAYIVSEWAPGEYLDDLIATGLPGPDRAAAIVAEAASALALAHAAGQPHLCLTLRSLRWDGRRLKITGLGTEAALRGLLPAEPAAAAARDTRALARVLYALLTGYWPGISRTQGTDQAAGTDQTAGNAQQAGTAHAAGTGWTGLPPAPCRRRLPYPPAQVRAGIPAGLSAITYRALVPQAPGKPALLTPAELAAVLRGAPGQALQRPAIAPRPAAPSRPGRMPLRRLATRPFRASGHTARPAALARPFLADLLPAARRPRSTRHPRRGRGQQRGCVPPPRLPRSPGPARRAR